MKRRCVALLMKSLVILCAFGTLASVSSAQEYPVKPVRYVVPNPPATPPDMIARVLAAEMSKTLGQPVVIENKPGAGHLIAYEHVAKQAPADGYTILITHVATQALLPLITKDIRFDPRRDLSPVIVLAKDRLMLGSAASLPWKNFTEFVAYARANPGKLNYGASAPIVQLISEALIRELRLNIVHVPYSSGGPYLLAMVNGEMHMGFASPANVQSWGDKFRVLAVSGDDRLPDYPNVPTFKELGFGQIRGNSFALNVATGTSQAIMDRLHFASTRALSLPDTQAQFLKIQMDAVGGSRGAAEELLVSDSKFLAEVANSVGLKPQ